MKEDAVLQPEEVESVLSGDTPPDDVGPQPYSLREPLAIPPHAQEAARFTLERIVSVLNDTIRSKAEIEIRLDDLQQQTAHAALAVLPPPAWVAGLVRGGSGGLLLALPPTVGLALVELALGGSGVLPEEGREPTPLESRVLRRLLASASSRLEEVVGATLESAECETGQIPRSIASAGETVAVGLLRFHVGESDHAALLLATAALLLPETAPRKERGAVGCGPLAALVGRIPLAVRPVLCAGSIGFRDLMALETGSVLRLDVGEDAILELRAEGEPVVRGRVVRQADRSVFAVERTLAAETCAAGEEES
jgi:flagellar motor switch protein FliM